MQLSDYHLSSRDPEAFVAIAVDDLVSTVGLAALHAEGELTREYLGMLSLYAIRRAAQLFGDDKSYGKIIRHMSDTFDPEHLSENLIRCLKDLLAGTSEDSLDQLNLPAGVSSILHQAGIRKVSALLGMSRKDLLNLHTLDDEAIDEIAESLEKLGYKEKAVKLAFPGSSYREIAKSRSDPDSVFSLQNELGNRLYRNGVKTLTQLRKLSVDDLAELDGISYETAIRISREITHHR